MSVEVIAIGGYEEVGKSISAKPVKNLLFLMPQNKVLKALEKVSSKFLISNFKNYRLKAQIPKKLAMEAKHEC
ncbi:MAG TPA: hypothetical protein VHO92_01525 [Methanobacterium sp.]|nr:hypothetical protein [Methanobacterium sp.]